MRRNAKKEGRKDREVGKRAERGEGGKRRKEMRVFLLI